VCECVCVSECGKRKVLEKIRKHFFGVGGKTRESIYYNYLRYFSFKRAFHWNAERAASKEKQMWQGRTSIHIQCTNK